MSDTAEERPFVRWADDVQGKKDYDGDLVSASCRYYPGGYRADGQPSAFAGILIWFDDGGDEREYKVYATVDLVAPTEGQVRELVEDWVQDQYTFLLQRLLGRTTLADLRGWRDGA